jgi:hypothetical protein
MSASVQNTAIHDNFAVSIQEIVTIWIVLLLVSVFSWLLELFFPLLSNVKAFK